MTLRFKKKLALTSVFLALTIVAILFTLQYNQPQIINHAAMQKNIPMGTFASRQLSPMQTELSATITTTPTPTPKPPVRTVYLGMWTEGFWDDTVKQLHPEKLIVVQNSIGKKVAIAHYYRGWQFLDSEAFLNELHTIASNGWRPMVSANPYYFDRCLVEGKTLYKMIADGHCDEFLHSVGRNLKAYGRPVFLRFAWEMNIDSIEWGIQRTGDSPADYVAAWRHFHDIVSAEQASNVIWVFSPNTETGTSVPFDQLYPGDQYVDWLGLDGYNWGNTQSWSTWQTFSQVYNASYQKLTALTALKPLMLAELNSTDQGGDKAAWYTDMLTNQIPNNYPRIKAIVLYNENRSAKENVNWLIDTSPQAHQAFIKAINTPGYLSSF